MFVVNQNNATIGINGVVGRSSLVSNLANQSIDIIIMDNFMDIASRLVRDNITGKIFFILSASYSAKLFLQRYVWTEFIDPGKSVDNYKDIIKWLARLQPNAEIYFLPFPGKVHGHCDRDSVLRAASFRKGLELRPFPAKLLNIPNVEAHHMLSIDDWCHYSPQYYEEIARQIL